MSSDEGVSGAAPSRVSVGTAFSLNRLCAQSSSPTTSLEPTKPRPCTQVRENMLGYTDNNDRLFVAELTGVAAWHKVVCTNEWLKTNL